MTRKSENNGKQAESREMKAELHYRKYKSATQQAMISGSVACDKKENTTRKPDGVQISIVLK